MLFTHFVTFLLIRVHLSDFVFCLHQFNLTWPDLPVKTFIEGKWKALSAFSSHDLLRPNQVHAVENIGNTFNSLYRQFYFFFANGEGAGKKNYKCTFKCALIGSLQLTIAICYPIRFWKHLTKPLTHHLYNTVHTLNALAKCFPG